jgi:hypothetical protein
MHHDVVLVPVRCVSGFKTRIAVAFFDEPNEFSGGLGGWGSGE